MDFIANKPPQNQAMLEKIGVSSVEELFSAIPASLLRPRPLEDDGLSEFEAIALMEEIAQKNKASHFESYLGGGAYEHHVPAICSAICSKSEFLTAYTPYQAEASQGMLQIIFEFQSAVAALTGMDVSNASLYDGASACAESLLLALRHQKGRHKILIASNLHPHYRAVVDQYLQPQHDEIISIPFHENGSLNIGALQHLLDVNTAAVLIQYPNFFGTMDDLKIISSAAKQAEALFVVAGNPLAYGLFATPGELGADIACGDAQPFGLPLQFGGPYVGYIACKQELVRQLPGRIVGETVDTTGKRGFVLTLQAREQHIRREKATSNICSNQALAALSCLIAMLWYGKEGIPKLALTNFQRAAYLKEALKKIPAVTVMSDAPSFNEFAVCFPGPLQKALDHFRKAGIEPGIPLGKFYPSLENALLVTVTETKNKEQLDRYIVVAKDYAEGNR